MLLSERQSSIPARYLPAQNYRRRPITHLALQWFAANTEGEIHGWREPENIPKSGVECHDMAQPGIKKYSSTIAKSKEALCYSEFAHKSAKIFICHGLHGPDGS